jgi:hypothetical protein
MIARSRSGISYEYGAPSPGQPPRASVLGRPLPHVTELRDRTICILLAGGWSRQVIADQYGFSYERAAQIDRRICSR